MAEKPDPTELERLAELVADETPIDWDERGTDASAERLRTIERIAAAYRRSAHDYDADHEPADAAPDVGRPNDVLFRWGHLDVLELLGSGSAGDVYRALDTKLDREVALKLRDAPDGGGDRASRFLREARSLGRVQHENVLIVHGADIAEGRVGLWSELVRGKTLEERLAEGGRLGAREATLLGLDLCRALAAIHDVGLLHGDVKASNVMRAEGGRTILLDFSSGRDVDGQGDEPLTPTGTPLALPPEVLDGGSADRSVDLYSLGALLYRLVSGRYPVVATTFAELQAKHARGDRTPLRDLRPDLPRAFIDVVERALSRPGERYGSAGEMEAALAATMGATSRRVPWLALAASLAIVAALAAVWRGGFLTTGSDFRVDAALFRADEDGDHSLERGGEVELGSQLFLEIEGSEPMHVYVLDEDASGEMFVLFPVEGLDLQNPLAPGVRHRLPGVMDGISQDWRVTSADGRETILVVSSTEALPPFERELARISPASSGVQLAYAELDPSVLEGLRGVAGMAPSRPRTGNGPGRLAELAEDFRKRAETADDLWIREFGLRSRAE